MINVILMLQYLMVSQANFAQENISSEEIKSSTKRGYSDNGFNIKAWIIGDYFSNYAGGFRNEDSYMANAILQTEFDLHKLLGLNGMTFQASGHGIKGEPFLENTGVLQGISNISAENQFKLFEAWIEQKLFEEKFSFLFGLYDLNSEFDVREASDVFINPSFGIGYDFSQSGQNGPSIFPYTSLALRMKFNFTESLEIIAAVFDGVPGSVTNNKNFSVSWDEDDGTLISTELIFLPFEKDFGKNYTKFSIGGWYYTSDFEKIADGLNASGNFGIYLNVEGFIYSEEYSANQGLALFGRLGIANSNFNPSDYSILGGINYAGLIPGREEDIFGLAITSVHLSKDFKNINGTESNYETIFELTYSFQTLSWLRIQPDVQYILNPAAATNSNNVIVGGMRAEVAF